MPPTPSRPPPPPPIAIPALAKHTHIAHTFPPILSATSTVTDDGANAFEACLIQARHDARQARETLPALSNLSSTPTSPPPPPFPALASLLASLPPSTIITLSLECQFLPKVDWFTNSDPFILLSSKPRGGAYTPVGRTEVIPNAHFPRFVTTFPVLASDELLLRVRARGYFASSVPLGAADCTVIDVLRAPSGCLVARMGEKESYVVVTADVRVEDDRVLRLGLRFDETARPRSKTHFVLSRAMRGGRWAPVYRSEGHGLPGRVFVGAEVLFGDVFGDGRRARLEFFQRRAGVDAKLVGFLEFGMGDIRGMQVGEVLTMEVGRDAKPPGRVGVEKIEFGEGEVSIGLVVGSKQKGTIL